MGTTHADTFYEQSPARFLTQTEIDEGYEPGQVIVETFKERGITPEESLVPLSFVMDRLPGAKRRMRR